MGRPVRAWVAQLVERVLGKDEVTGSIPVPGSRLQSAERGAAVGESESRLGTVRAKNVVRIRVAKLIGRLVLYRHDIAIGRASQGTQCWLQSLDSLAGAFLLGLRGAFRYSLSGAGAREKYLKSGVGREYLKSVAAESVKLRMKIERG